VQRVTPLAHLSYPEQLTEKWQWLNNVVQSFATDLNKEFASKNEHLPGWFKKCEGKVILDP
jgi:hypothetical protein